MATCAEAARGYAGCESLAITNWILRRDDQVGCVVFSPLDAVEAQFRVAKQTVKLGRCPIPLELDSTEDFEPFPLPDRWKDISHEGKSSQAEH